MMKFDMEKFKNDYAYQAKMRDWLAEQFIELFEGDCSYEEMIVEVLKYVDPAQTECFFDDVWLEKNERYCCED